jgi:DNA-binding beta-propeller fold protein YncE
MPKHAASNRRGTVFLALTIAFAIASAAACGLDTPATAPVEAGVVDAAPPPLESSPPAIIAEDKRKDATSSPVVFDTERGRVWTANGDVGTVSLVDIDAPRLLAEIAIGKDVRSVALSPDFKWIAAVDREGAQVVLVDAETREVKRAIAVGTHPRAAVWDAQNPRFLYVAIEDEDAIAVIDRTLGVLVETIKVGRLPSGVAVSRKRPELYAVHRIDGKITIVDTTTRKPAADVVLEEQPKDPDPKVPQGRPFAFETLAWAPSGVEAWLGHELLAPTRPFQFQSTVFPAVSVVDLSPLRLEVATDPVTGTIQGRKLLFDAINLPDATANATIVSQPCAAAIHPNGVAGYVLACGSEDLLVFDVLSGRAVDVLRDLPGDHPVGIALDEKGDRAFLLADQSHTLARVDLAGGSVIKHVRLLGAPIPLVAKDPVDPELREGLKLFFRASSRKGALATTGNDWMSCASCHLDGFVTTNQVFFESALADPSADAQIGHVGLKDLFSTAPTPDSPAFEPHDVLVALLDQGGLVPDRTGANRDGAVDPSAPPIEARTMARRLARVIARDLPVGPSWILPGHAPDATYDGAWCGNCHKAEYEAWRKSAHAHSGEDPMMKFCAQVERGLRGPQYERFCVGCHDPVGARLGDVSLSAGRGVTCLGCHDVTRTLRAGGNGDLEHDAHDWTVDHKAQATARLAVLRTPEFCGGCHTQFVPGSGLEAISTHHEWQKTKFANPAPGEAPTTCIDCHMPKDQSGVADHAAIGGNVYLAAKFNGTDPAFVERVRKNLQGAITLAAVRVGADVKITVTNRAGHDFPTGVTDVREPWVELQALDANQKVVAHFGGPGGDGLLPASAARLNMDIAGPDGGVLLLHELSDATRVPFVRRVPGGGSLDLTIPAPALPAGAASLDAVLVYRNVRTPFFRAATGDAFATPNDVEVARTQVP